MTFNDNLHKEKVLRFFSEICAIPHGSANTKKISDYCVEFAKTHGLRYIQDENNNVIIFKNATGGYEDKGPVIIQGHLDMVCEKSLESSIDFLTDGIEMIIDGDWIHANGTTLGGDDGIAIAMALALLDSDDIPHPGIEAVFTVDEEIGMLGAEALDTSPLRGKMLVNLDSESEGVFTVSCAGGVSAQCTIPIVRETVSGVRAVISIGGLIGGHSGVEIDKERGSSNQLMGRLLNALYKKAPFNIIDISGGSKDNAIPLFTSAEIIFNGVDADKITSVIREYDAIYKNELAGADPGVCVDISVQDTDEVSAIDASGTKKIIFALLTVPYGIHAMSTDIKGLVQTSSNLGILNTTEEACHINISIRSSVATQKQMILDRIESIITSVGGRVTVNGEYPGWEYKRDSKLRNICIESYKRLFKKEPEVIAIHAGLECGLFTGKIPELDAVSFGPDILDIHTSKERMSISSIERTWEFLLVVLKNI